MSEGEQEINFLKNKIHCLEIEISNLKLAHSFLATKLEHVSSQFMVVSKELRYVAKVCNVVVTAGTFIAIVVAPYLRDYLERTL